ncbi:MAG: helix-turn-helix transcriptional regulator [Bacteroidales bacterium]|jgi:DNA-binding transcriptional ArsR family regulator|nr:helix-turn-helix transcriptional regulator [Bacteroidales bacterium]NPV35320.1 helix-turn-helix transcriptional regulator [Bacteroidales bacterium]
MVKKNQAISDELRQTAIIAKALSHPIRLYIVKKLAHMNQCCYSGDLAEEIGIGRSTLSQHLKELKYAGLIQGEIEAPYIKYCLNQQNWAIARQLFADLFNE